MAGNLWTRWRGLGVGERLVPWFLLKLSNRKQNPSGNSRRKTGPNEDTQQGQGFENAKRFSFICTNTKTCHSGSALPQF